MTPRFSVSSKDGSNVKEGSASSSEGDCKIVFVWVLDLVPYGCVCWGVPKPLVGFFTSKVGRMVFRGWIRWLVTPLCLLKVV